MFESPLLDLANAFLGHAIVPCDAGEGFTTPVVAQTEAPGNHKSLTIIELAESLPE